MPDKRESWPDRPAGRDSSLDVVGEVLGAVHLTTAVFGRLDLGAPWRLRGPAPGCPPLFVGGRGAGGRLRVPARGYLSFYVVARGSAWIEVGDEGNGADGGDGKHRAVALSAGDAVLLPQGSAHRLRDADRSAPPPLDFDYAACPHVWIGEGAHLGGGGPVTSVVAGNFTFGGTASRNPLLSSLPALVHLPAGASAANPQLAGVVPLILSESAAPGPGATIVLARLADLLLTHALRYWVATAGADPCGLRAVSDPAIGAALKLIHARPAEPWTVESLARSVAMSGPAV